jgi:hypothetical protein
MKEFLFGKKLAIGVHMCICGDLIQIKFLFGCKDDSAL